MEVSDADGEWSEGTDDAHKSATTSGSEMEESPQPPLPFLPAMIPMLQKSMSMDQLMVKPSITKAKSCDAVDRIMDRIDAEINSMTNWQAPPFMKRKRPSKSERSQLKKLGVEFDTGDETAAEATLKEGLAKVNADKCEKDTDTGVGTGSIVDEAVSDSEPVQPKHKHIKGKVHTYADAAESEGNLTEDDPQRHHSDLDSDTAQQLEEKFQHIMKKKSGGYLRDLKVGPKMYSDQDSIKTEEFEEKFREVMMGPSREVMMAHSASQLSAHSRQSKPSELHVIPPSKKSRTKVKGRGSVRHRSSGKTSGTSDLESVMTEDFERQFHNMMVKQVAQVPITSFDQLIVDSDLDTIQSEVIHDKFRQALSHSLNYDGSDVSSSETEATMEAYLEKKYQDILRKHKPGRHGSRTPSDAGTADGHHGHRGSPRRPVEPLSDTDHRDSETDGEGSAVNRTAVPRYNSRSGATNGQCNSLAEDEAVVRNVQEIKEESARIQKEMEEERRMKMIPSSPKRATTPPREEFSSPHITKTMSSTPVRSPKTRTRIYTSTATSPIPFSLDSPKASKRASQDELKELLEMIRKAKQEKQTALHELRTVKDTVQLNQADLMRAEKQLKETRARAEDARTELMLAEFKRDSANKELDHAVQELKKKRERLKILDVQIEAEDTTDALQDAGFGREQVLALLAERDALRVQCEQHDNRELERQELERQLSSTKEELFAEQKRAREKIEALEEELEAIAQRYEDSSTEKEESHKTLTQLQAQCTLLEQEKQHLLREKTEESQRYGSREMTELRKQIQDGREQLNNVKAQLNSKDELNLQLREQMVALQQQVTKHAELRDAMDQQHRQEVNALQQEKEETVAKVKQAAVAEKEKAVSELKQQLDQSHLRQQQHLTDVQGTLASKEVELGMLKERLKNHDEIVLQLGDQIRQDTREQIRSVVEVEKQAWQAEKEKSWSQQKQELENKVHQLQEELDTEKHICEQQLKQVTSLKQELEEQRQKHRAAYRDRLTALNQSMEEAKEDRKREMEQVKETLGRESMKETERLRKDIQELEEEMEQLRLDKKELTQKNKEAVCQLEEMEKTIVYEINQECRRIAQELGITPRTTAATGYIPTYSPGGSALARSLGRSATTTALANLKASYDELLHHVEELKQELQTQKLTTQQLETKKEHLEEVEKLHETLGKDRSLARALKEKDKEITEIQRSMKKWKDETTEKLAKKFQEEMSRELEKRTKEFKKQHREWERERASLVREVDRLDRDMGRAALSQSAPFIGSGRGMDSETLRMLRQMQSKMKQLRTENSTLRRGIHNLSMPDLSASAPLNSSMTEANLSMVDDERSVRRLEQQVQLSDHKAHLAEERAEKNQQLLNNKMLELSKLQATLTQQTKELMQLERAYSQLQQKAARSAARGPSTTR